MNRTFDRAELFLFLALGTISVASVLTAFFTEQYYLALIPFGLLAVYTGVINFRLLYFLLLFTIPFSIEYSFSESLATDLPDEPLMIGLMFVSGIFVLTNYRSLPTGYFAHVLILALIAHLLWIFTSALTSVEFIVSLKVFLSKIWYTMTFSVLTAILIRTKEDIKKLFWCIYIPLTLLIIQVIIRHGLQGFSFDDINRPMMPFFRNHVNYAAIVTIFFPFILLVRNWYQPGTALRKLLTVSVVLYIGAIYLSYTRTCYVALLTIIPFYFIVRYKLMKHAFMVAGVGAALLIAFLLHENRYMNYAPHFEETIYHDEFGDHLSSTFEGKDVSSMERVYRWVAAHKMFQERPWMGFGAGNFYPYYMRYTLTSFETYVSDNPERSTTHNYLLLILTEQGVIGLTVFLFLTVALFVYGEKIYHSMKNKEDQRLVMTLLIVLAMVYVNLLLSDLLESDKVGPFFYISLSLLAAWHIRHQSFKPDSQ